MINESNTCEITKRQSCLYKGTWQEKDERVTPTIQDGFSDALLPLCVENSKNHAKLIDIIQEITPRFNPNNSDDLLRPYSIDHAFRMLALDVIEKLERELFKKWSVTDCLKFFSHIEADAQATFFSMVPEETRFGMLSDMLPHKLREVKIELYWRNNRLRYDPRDNRLKCHPRFHSIPQVWIADSASKGSGARECVACHEQYQLGADVLWARCKKHSFHSDCAAVGIERGTEELRCLIC